VTYVPGTDADIEVDAGKESDNDVDDNVPRVYYGQGNVFDNPVEPVSDPKAASRVPRKGVPILISRRVP
jgi:hypothetical protein